MNQSVQTSDALKATDVRIEFPGRRGLFTAVHSASLHVAPGEIIGVVGESGAGKSTIGNAVIQLLEPPGRVSEGSINVLGTEILSLAKDDMAKLRGSTIGMIFQDPMTSLNPLYTVGKQIIETMQTHFPQQSESALREKAIDWLNKVGIPNAALRVDNYPHQFSGGQRQRVVIALVLCAEPRLIIADEPTTALDVTLKRQVLELIKGLCKERQVAVVLITHDMGAISEIAERVYVMLKGRIVEEGTTAQILGAPREEYTKSLIAAIPRIDVKVKRFHVVDNESASRITAVHDRALQWLTVSDTIVPVSDKAVLKLEDLRCTFVTRRSWLPKNRRYLNAVDGVSLEVQRGEVFGLVGESGCGKTTIGKMVAGLQPPTSGRILFEGLDLAEKRSRTEEMALRRAMQMIFQDPYSSLNPRRRIIDCVAEPIRFHKVAKDEAEVRSIVELLLARVGMDAAAAEKYPHQFSGGQRQRICIARALATRPRFLICDEPTSALDVSIQAQTLNLLKDLQEDLGLTMLFVSHDLAVIRQMCDRVGVMRAGVLVEVGTAEQVFNDPQHEYTKALLSAMPSMQHLAMA